MNGVKLHKLSVEEFEQAIRCFRKSHLSEPVSDDELNSCIKVCSSIIAFFEEIGPRYGLIVENMIYALMRFKNIKLGRSMK